MNVEKYSSNVVIHKSIVKLIDKSNFYSVIADDTTDDTFEVEEAIVVPAEQSARIRTNEDTRLFYKRAIYTMNKLTTHT